MYICSFLCTRYYITWVLACGSHEAFEIDWNNVERRQNDGWQVLSGWYRQSFRHGAQTAALVNTWHSIKNINVRFKDHQKHHYLSLAGIRFLVGQGSFLGHSVFHHVLTHSACRIDFISSFQVSSGQHSFTGTAWFARFSWPNLTSSDYGLLKTSPEWSYSTV